MTKGGVGGATKNVRGYSDSSIIGGTPRIERKRRSWNYNGNTTSANTASGASNSSTSSRFNIEVDEVPSVRTAVSPWKRTLAIPLRLDIYYEHDACYDGTTQSRDVCQGQGGESLQPQPQQQPQRELLERWCIDYIPSQSNNNNASLSTSPSTSPYSSRIMAGTTIASSFLNDKAATNISQLRQVCKRIVVLLRSLHCLTRMLPAYRLKCLLMSHINVAQSSGSQQVGWGRIGYSIHMGNSYEHDALTSAAAAGSSLPSPSFCRHSLPNVATPHGKLWVSVMYDATLNPNDMMRDLVERRSEWMQRCCGMMGAGGGQLLQHQHPQLQQQYQLEQVPYPIMGGGSPASTRPIPIIAQGRAGHPSQHRAIHYSGGATNNSIPRQAIINNSREYNSCPPNANMMGGPASLGGIIPTSSMGGHGHRSRAVSDFIISDYHNSPKLKPTSSPLGGNDNATASVAGGGTQQRVMSGLSLAMMNEQETHPNISNHGQYQQQQLQQQLEEARKLQQAQQYQQQQEEEEMILPFGSPATRAAFHNPPPLYNHASGTGNVVNESQQQQQEQQHVIARSSSPGGVGIKMAENHNPGSVGTSGSGTHFFHRHGGYGYGYNNGSNVVQFGEEQPPPPLPPPPFQPAAGSPGSNRPLSTSPRPMMGTPPANNQGLLLPSAGSRSPSEAPFVNPTMMQQQPHSPSLGTMHSRSCTPPVQTSNLASRQYSPLGNNNSHQQGGSSDHQRSNSKRISSSSMQLLPPITSLDILQKSPFCVAGRKTTTAATAGKEEMLTSLSSIPRMVPTNSTGERDDSGNGSSIAVSTLGGGSSSNNPLMPSDTTELSSVAVAVVAGGSHHAGNNGNNARTESSAVVTQTETEELPFAVDDDDENDNPLVSGATAASSSPSKSGSPSLWGSTTNKADNALLDETLSGSHVGGGGGMADIACSLAVSSLHHRCATDGKIRLKMFESTRTVESAIVATGASGGDVGNFDMATNASNGGNDNGNGGDGDDLTSDFASIKNQLLDFRSFGASLMVGSDDTHDSQTE